MKKWLFVICPVVMLGLFLVFYSTDRKRVIEKEHQYKEAQAAKLAEKKRKDDEIREKTRKENEAKDLEKAREEAAKEAEKRAKEDKERQDDLEATTIARRNFESRTAEIRNIDTQITAAQRQRDAALKEINDLSKVVEQAKIDRRNAELDFERSKTQLLSVLVQDPLLQAPTSAAPAAGGRGGARAQ